MQTLDTSKSASGLSPGDFIVYKTSLRSRKSINSGKAKRVGMKISPQTTAKVKLKVNRFNRGFSISIHSKNLDNLNINASLINQKPAQKPKPTRLQQSSKKSKV